MRVKIMVALFAAIFSLPLGFYASDALAQAAPPWGAGGGTVDPKDPNLWHNPKDGPSDYVWNAKICRWVYKNAGKDAMGNHKVGDLTSQGPPTGAKMNPGSSDQATNPTTGETFTWGDDKPDPKNPNGPPVPGSGNGWVNDKTNTRLCPPGAAVAMAPGGVKIRENWIVEGGIGLTFAIPNIKVGYNGTGVGSGASTTFNNVNVMPTLELDVWHPIGMGMAVGVSGDLMLPTSGTSSKSVMANVPGTQTFKQGLMADAFVNWAYDFCDCVAYDREDYEDCLDWYLGPPVRINIGAGLAMTQWEAGEVFSGNGDNFSTGWQTNILPAFHAGVTVNPGFIPGQFQLEFTDILPGNTKTMPNGNGASYGTAKLGNTIDFTAKWVKRF